MKILQIRTQSGSLVKTYKAQDITNIEFEEGFVSFDIHIFFGNNKRQDLGIERNSKTDDKSVIKKMKELYNRLLESWLTDTAENSIFIIDLERVDGRLQPVYWETYNMVDGFEELKFQFPKPKKYNVNIYYDTMYQVEVEAESEEEAVEKARRLANDESNQQANDELLSGLCEEGHDVIEVK